MSAGGLTAVQQLFASTDDPESSEARWDDVDSQLSRFLRTETVSQHLTDEEIHRRFGQTQIPEVGRGTDEYLAYLFREVIPHSVNNQAPKCLGHMTSALPNFIEPLNRVMTTLNQNVVKLESSNAFTYYERQALAMLHRLIFGAEPSFYAHHAQNTASTLGMMVSGGTLGNLAGLWCARNAGLGPSGDFPGVEVAGLHAALAHYGYKGAVVIGSSLMHYSFEKAADILGMGAGAVRKVKAGIDGRVDIPEVRRELIRARERKELVVALVGVAGTTETGSVDPLRELAGLASEFKVHFHVDAAWGGPLLFSSRLKPLLDGIQRADSVTVDGHKQLYLPLGIGMLLLRDPARARSIEKVANYIIRPGARDLGRRTLEGSRPALVIFLHGALHIIGRNGYQALVEQSVATAQQMAQSLRRRPEFELLADPALNILVYRYLPEHLRARAAQGRLTASDNEEINELNRCLQEAQWSEGRSFTSRTLISHTRYGGDPAIECLRAVVANPNTTIADIEWVLDEQASLGASFEGELGKVTA